MPFFKSTYNILKKPDEDEVFDINWFDSPTLQLPPSLKWDYQREMTIEDVDIWEVLVERGGGLGVYAAWCPYAEFYLITTGSDTRNQWHGFLGKAIYNYNDRFWETYYGPNSQEKVHKRASELGMSLTISKVWVEDEDMWLYSKEDKYNKPKLIIP
jgi:hypothetical protein